MSSPGKNKSRGGVSRRGMLRRITAGGLSALIPLPALEAFEARPASRGAEKASRGAEKASRGAEKAPVRLAYVYFPNGIATGSWHPKKVGEKGELLELNPWMSPLEPFRDDLIIPKNVWTPRGNGHAAGTATWLTGGGYDRKRIDAGGLSADQIAAREVGESTLLPSLQLSLVGQGHFSKDLTRNTLSWVGPRRPASREVEPRAVFDRMFRGGRSGKGTGAVERSVLDLVRDQSKRVAREVSESDKRKIDEYLDAIRSIEKRVAFAETKSRSVAAGGGLTDTLARPKPGIPSDHKAYVRLMLDLVALAFWSDATRVATFMLDHGQSNRYFNFIPDVQGTWHALSHYRDFSGNTEDDDGVTSWKSMEEKRGMFNEVTRWHHEQVAYFIDRLRSIPDANGGSLLDQSMVVYGSSLSDGHEHSARDLPLIVAGRGGKTIRTGRQLAFRKPESMSNLHLALLRRVGAKVREFGGSDTPMEELAG